MGEALKHLRREVARLRGAALHKGDRAAAPPPPGASSGAAGRAPRPVRILVGTTAHSKARAESPVSYHTLSRTGLRWLLWCPKGMGV